MAKIEEVTCNHGGNINIFYECDNCKKINEIIYYLNSILGSNDSILPPEEIKK